jgi:hypothetical protein
MERMMIPPPPPPPGRAPQQGYQQYGYQQYGYQQAPPPTQSHGYAVASMVLGILSILFCWFLGIFGLTMAILAIAFAGRAPLDQYGRRPGMAKAGRMMGIIGCTLSSLYLLALVLAIASNS